MPNETSALVKYAAALREQLRQEVEKKFPDYNAAITEILRLQMALDDANEAYAQVTHKRPRGRPAKMPTGMITQTLSLMDALRRFALPTQKEKRKGGRPRQTTPGEKADTLHKLEELKKKYALERGKKFKDDRDFFTYFVHETGLFKLLEQRERREKVNEFCKEIGYYRDETGIRLRKRKTQNK